jgi:hypothetical protein
MERAARGLRLIRMVCNRQLGASTYPASYAAHVVLGGDDGYVSSQTAGLPVSLFVAALSSQAADAGEETSFEPAAATDAGRIWVSLLDDYQHRPAALRNLSPYEFVVLFNKTPVSSTEEAAGVMRSGRWRFAPEHPQYDTRVLATRQRLHVPQLYMDPPHRPDSSDDIGDEHRAYAAYFLALLLPDDDARARLSAAEGCGWKALMAWEATDPVSIPDVVASLCVYFTQFARRLHCLPTLAFVSVSFACRSHYDGSDTLMVCTSQALLSDDGLRAFEIARGLQRNMDDASGAQRRISSRAHDADDVAKAAVDAARAIRDERGCEDDDGAPMEVDGEVDEGTGPGIGSVRFCLSRAV